MVYVYNIPKWDDCQQKVMLILRVLQVTLYVEALELISEAMIDLPAAQQKICM